MPIRGIFLAILLWLATPVWPETAPVLKAVTTEYPPFEYVENGVLRGNDVDTVRTVIRQMGYRPEFLALPWARAEMMVRNGSADLLFSLTASPQRERFYLFTAPISTARDVFYARKGSGITWSRFEDLADLRIGVSGSYSYAPEFMGWLKQDNAPMMTINQEQPNLSGLRLVALGRIDLFICEQTACDYLIEKNQAQYPDLTRVTAIPGTVGDKRFFRAAFSRKRPDAETLRSEFNRVLKQLNLGASD